MTTTTKKNAQEIENAMRRLEFAAVSLAKIDAIVEWNPAWGERSLYENDRMISLESARAELRRLLS